MSKDTIEIKPVTLKQGLPKSEKNSLFGSEQTLIENPGREIVAVVTFSVDEVVERRMAGEMYPVVSIERIEAIVDDDARFEVLGFRDAAYKARTGTNQLDMLTPDDAESGDD